MKISLYLLVTGLVSFQAARAVDSPALPTNAPPSIELRDQFENPQTLSFPREKVTILAIADRKGSEQVAAWITALKPLYGERVDIRGLADVRGVPGFLQSRIRKHFQQTQKYPVMLDWSGSVCDRLGYRRGVANILVIGRKGAILRRYYREATKTAVASASASIEDALAH